MTLLTTSPAEAAEIIRRGGLVAFPTETVYGLGADAFNIAAIGRIFTAKNRPPDNPLIAHISSTDQIALLAKTCSADTRKLIDAFFPGSLTVVVEKTDRVPEIATAGLGTIGIRMPRHQLASELLRACGVPLVAPSANLSGRPSPTTWHAVFEDLDGRIDCILQGDAAEIGLESTVIDVTGVVPIVLRKGAVSLEQLREVVPETREGSAEEQNKGKSPGLMHRHYSPRARVRVVGPVDTVDSTSSAAFIGLTRREGDFAYTSVCRSVEEYAHEVFEFFRECDRRDIRTIYCESVPEQGVGAALMDRVRRAAEER